MSYSLGFVDGNKITAIRELSGEEIQEYNTASKCLFDFSKNQELYTIVLLNYDEFFETLKKCEIDYAQNARSWNLVMQTRMVLNINRRLLNYLSSIRSFLDHTETRLKEENGAESSVVKHFLGACSKEYDNVFSYRFFYKLRNYTQHLGLPVGELSLISKEDPPYSNNITYQLEVKFSRDELLKFKKWKQPLTEEIRNMDEQFDISPHVSNVMDCLNRINHVLIQDDLASIIRSAEYIDNLIAPLKGKPVKPTIFQINEGNRPTDKIVTILEIPFHLVQYALEIKKQMDSR